MNRPGAKFTIVFNLVMNIPMAIAMSVTAPILMGEEVFNSHTLLMILIGFILATIINLLIPVQKISAGFAGLFKIKSDSFKGQLVGNIPVCLIFVVVIGIILTTINVKIFPEIIFAFLATFVPLYIVCFIVSIIFVPLAVKAATAADK